MNGGRKHQINFQLRKLQIKYYFHTPSNIAYKRKYNIFNKTVIETVSKLMLDKKPPQASNNITNLKDSFVLLEITDGIHQINPEHEE
jgi:hypothetical protein